LHLSEHSGKAATDAQAQRQYRDYLEHKYR